MTLLFNVAFKNKNTQKSTAHPIFDSMGNRIATIPIQKGVLVCTMCRNTSHISHLLSKKVLKLMKWQVEQAPLSGYSTGLRQWYSFRDVLPTVKKVKC